MKQGGYLRMKGKPAGQVTREELVECLEFVAELVEYRPRALILFERLEEELRLFDESPLARARAMAARRRASAGLPAKSD